ncbi:MAG: terminase [Candidatus Pacebacteria bacterium]|jgi:hypothetical protein|nr:terminase [Candidatus Paceibacterota bacterium]|tara:strand:+ start:1318 stop:1743 length:426 start_codon:yes stop_codon:yes gene_type:complete
MVKNTFEKNMEDIFDLPESEVKKVHGEVLPPEDMKDVQSENEIQADYKIARENLRSIINKGNTAIDSLTDLATASEHPRSFEALSALMKTCADASKDLLSVQQQKKDVLQTDKDDPQNVTNAVFIGSTKELQKMLKDQSDE